MTKEIVTQEKTALPKTVEKFSKYQLEKLFNNFESQLIKSLPDEMMKQKDRFFQMCAEEFFSNPQLMKCTPASILGYVKQTAMMGFFPSKVLGLAYPVPYWNSKNKVFVCNLQIGYKGLMQLIRRSGLVSNIYANIIYKDEPYELIGGTNPEIKHTIRIDIDRTDETIIAAYAVAQFKDGFKQSMILNMQQIEQARKHSKTQYKDGQFSIEPIGIWKDFKPQMCQKTVIRRLASQLPLDADSLLNIDSDNKIINYSENGNIELEDYEVIEESETAYDAIKADVKADKLFPEVSND